MPYQIKWEPDGAIKYFNGVVSGRDLIDSEQEVFGHPDRVAFRYVISVYLTAHEVHFSAEDIDALRQLRAASFNANPRTRFAVVADDEAIEESVQRQLSEKALAHPTALFDNYNDACAWATAAGQPDPAGLATAPLEAWTCSPHEQQRLQALRGYGILDSLPEADYNHIVMLASQICQTPIAVISLVDMDRQWFKAQVGLDVSETPRDQAFCAQAIQHPSCVMEVSDATLDPRFSANPLVLGHPNIRFYAGVPLVTKAGDALGTVCVIDQKPRTLTASQTDALKVLGSLVMSMLEMRREIASLKAGQAGQG